MDPVTQQMVLGAVRTLLAAAGGWLVTHHYLDNAVLEQVIGALMILIPFVWSVWDKHRAEKETKSREAIAMNAGVTIANQQPGQFTPQIPHEVVPAVLASLANADVKTAVSESLTQS